MNGQLKIVSGSLRGRRLNCNVDSNLRPTSQRAREALFSLLGNAIPERPFFDVFAGSGVVGLEAISRGASSCTFVERDIRLLNNLERHIEEFDVAEFADVARSDAYRWAERWVPPLEPVNIFISPPFVDFKNKMSLLVEMTTLFQENIAEDSIIVLQGEHEVPLEGLPRIDEWEDRRYGRNHLLIWIKS